MGDGKAASEEGPRSVTRLIDRLDDGQFGSDLAAEFHALTTELSATASDKSATVKGRFTIHIDLHMKANGETNVVGTHKRTASKPKPAGRTMWVSKGGNLIEDNPRQQKLPLREVAPPKRRNIDDDESESDTGESNS